MDLATLLARVVRNVPKSVSRELRVSRLHPGFLHLFYVLTLSLLGAILLLSLPLRDRSASSPAFLDLLYTSAAAASVAGLNAVDMERFSDTQILALTCLMFLGGEIFLSLLGLLLHPGRDAPAIAAGRAKRDLTKAILIYLALFHIAGMLAVASYFWASPAATSILAAKRLGTAVFAVCAVASSFANVGILPNNENMAAFTKHPGLSLLLAPLILAGGTLYPVLLRALLRALEKLKLAGSRKDLDNALDLEAVKYRYILSRRRTAFLAVTVAGLFAVQFLVLVCQDWNAAAFDGLSPSEKLVAAAFQSVSTRHAGEGTIDFSLVSPAFAVVAVAMMYLPAHTTFLPEEEEEGKNYSKEAKGMWSAIARNCNMSQISYIGLFLVLACVTERKRISEDPLNYSVLKILFEIVSVYGNVGLSMGYSCGRQLHPDGSCKDGSYSFSGRWNDAGKLLMIVVMIFGKLKKFHMGGGKAWKLAVPTTTSPGTTDQEKPLPPLQP